MTNTCACSRPTDLFLCNECVGALVNDLRGVPDLINELRTTGAKLDVTGSRGGGGSSERPMGVNVGALETKGTLEHLLLAMWMRCGLTPRPNISPIAFVEGILGSIHILAGHKSAGSYKTQLAAETERGWDIVDATQHRIRLGNCETPECGTPITAHEGDHKARCTTCGESYDITELWQTRALHALGHDGTPVRAAQAARALAKHGVKVTPKDIENWVKWGHLTATEHDDKGRRLFKIQDVYQRALRAA